MAFIPQRALEKLKIDQTNLQDGSVTNTKLAAGSVGSANIQAGAVGSSQIADGSIATVDVTPAALTAFKGTDKRFDLTGVLAVSVDGGKVSATGLPEAPLVSADGQNVALVVMVNGVEQKIGNGVKTTDCYFSADSNGATAKTYANLAAGDLLFLNAVIAKIYTEAGDSVFLKYRV